MKGINKVILVGNLGQDPETRFFPDGGAITNASMATSESWRDKQTGEQKEKTEWHRVVFKDRGNYKLGQIAGEYLKKGSKVYVEGKLNTRKWEKDGQERYTTEVVADAMQMLDTKSGESSSGAGTSPGGSFSQSAPQPSPGADIYDDDIPF